MYLLQQPHKYEFMLEMPRKSIDICPPGVFCITPGVTLFLTIFIIILLVGLVLIQNMNDTTTTLQNMTAKQFFNANAFQQRPPPPVQIALGMGGDDRYTRAPEPLRSWAAPPAIPVGGALPPPFGFATQGLPDKYQSYGFIQTLNGQTLPLYGRRLATRSDRYNYYTRTDTYNPVPIPVMFKGRDCQDSVGCEEIFNGDKVLTGAGTEGKVSVYQFDGPPYIPYI
jgi:hypothetical protein